ncbi:hypothetical protein [Mycobacterium sp. SA01]|uniref:hypothetical protein n=1 Tax=Mycobacterium sp. SA01 TaxID=3238820 RepID=UPI00351BA0AB
MAPRISKDERLERLVATCRRRVDSNSDAPRSLTHTPDSLLATLARDAGYQRISPKFLSELAEKLRAAGLSTFPDLADPTIGRSTRIYLFDRNHPIQGIQPSRFLFEDERQMSRFLTANFAALSYARKNGLKLRGPEVRIAGNCIIDLLAESRKSGELIGFELKAREADERLVAQAKKYMTALNQQAKKEHRPGAQLLIVTGQPDESLKDSIQLLSEKYEVPTKWLLYKLSVDLTDAP